MPTTDFLIDQGKGNDDGGMEFDEEDETTGDNWILVDAAPKKKEFDMVKMTEKI